MEVNRGASRSKTDARHNRPTATQTKKVSTTSDSLCLAYRHFQACNLSRRSLQRDGHLIKKV